MNKTEWDNEKNCLDCLHCKVINKHKELKCKAGMWTKMDEDEKFVKLSGMEIRFLNIRPRDLFHEAIRCHNFVSMD
jgi:hypothetical protein